MDILEMVRTRTEGQVTIGSGTLYDLLELFVKVDDPSAWKFYLDLQEV